MSKKSTSPKALPSDDRDQLLQTLQKRFEKNMDRHKGVKWADVRKKLGSSPQKLWSLNQMELSGGEPDIVQFDKKVGEYTFCDCSPESPKGRRSICFDHEALEARKMHKPDDSAMNMAEEMGVNMLTEDEYRQLQELGEFDTKTSSWVQTPADVRKLGGALFCDRRFGKVFLYHNGADSYYAARGFRASLKV